MRQKTPKKFICEKCGIEYFSTGTVSRFCSECKKEHEKIRKREWAREKYGYTPKVKHTDPCCICGGKFSGFFDGKPYCNKHWLRMYLNGSPDLKPHKSTNIYEDHGEYMSIFSKHGEELLVDKDDFNKLKDYSWCISKTGYGVARINGKVKKIHRYILGIDDPNILVDHKNGNPFDNRKENLRTCTALENSRNTSRTKNRDLPLGVKTVPSGKYLAYIMVNGKTKDLGRYEDINDAIHARDLAEIKYCGEFAPSLYKPPFNSMPIIKIKKDPNFKGGEI